MLSHIVNCMASVPAVLCHLFSVKDRPLTLGQGKELWTRRDSPQSGRGCVEFGRSVFTTVTTPSTLLHMTGMSDTMTGQQSMCVQLYLLLWDVFNSPSGGSVTESVQKLESFREGGISRSRHNVLISTPCWSVFVFEKTNRPGKEGVSFLERVVFQVTEDNGNTLLFLASSSFPRVGLFLWLQSAPCCLISQLETNAYK